MMPIQPQYLYGAALLGLVLLALLVVFKLARRERRTLRSTLVKQLDELLGSLDQYNELTDILSLLDVADLLLRHIKHVDPTFNQYEAYRQRISVMRAGAIMRKVSERVFIQINEMRNTSVPGTLMKYGRVAESLITRWMGHPSLSPNQRQTLQTRLREIEDLLRGHPITANVWEAYHHERANRHVKALDRYRESLEELNELDRLRSDDQLLLEEIENRITALQQKLDQQTAASQTQNPEDPTLNPLTPE